MTGLGEVVEDGYAGKRRDLGRALGADVAVGAPGDQPAAVDLHRGAGEVVEDGGAIEQQRVGDVGVVGVDEA